MLELLQSWFDRRLHTLGDRLETLTKEIRTMSASLNQRLADLTTLVEKMSADDTKFRADVLVALAAIGNGPLTADQQAAFDNLMSMVQADDDATVAADAALQQSPPPGPTV
jgi:hypothetical protein